LTSSSGTALTGLGECIEPLSVLPNIGASQINDKVEQRDRFGENYGDVLATLGRDLSKPRVRFGIDLKSAANEVHEATRLVERSRGWCPPQAKASGFADGGMDRLAMAHEIGMR
jgi:hypothetical protein